MPNRSHGRNRPHPIPAQRAFGALQPGASDDPTAPSAMVSASPHCAAPNSIPAFVAPTTENQVLGGGLYRLRRTSTLRSARQDAQINCLSTLTIFMKQTTYLATLPNPKISGK